MMSARAHYRQRRMTHVEARDGDRRVNDVHFSRVDYVFYSATTCSGLVMWRLRPEFERTRRSRGPIVESRALNANDCEDVSR